MPLTNFIFKISNLKLSKGFTLIEVMISLGILALIAGVAIPNLRYFNQAQELDNATLQLINVLETAQSSASSRIQCSSGEKSRSWFVQLNTAGANDTFSLASRCESGVESYSITDSPITTVNSSNISMDTDRCPGQDVRVFFAGLSLYYQCFGGVITKGGIRITLTRSGSSKVIVVEQGGIIRSE